MARTDNWLQAVMDHASLWVTAHHKLWHLTDEQLKCFLGDWKESDCPYGPACACNDHVS
jgi:hypothetical protein